MKSEFIQNLQKLNEKEVFMKEFLTRNPEYKTKIIGKNKCGEKEYNDFKNLVIKEWKNLKKSKCPFERISYKVEANVFIPEDKNIGITTNLRYMPLIIHNQEYIVINYVLKSGGSLYIDKNSTFELYDGDVIIRSPNSYSTFKAQNDDSIIVDIFLSISEFNSVFLGLIKDDSVLSKLFIKAVYGMSNGYILWRCNGDIELENKVIEIYKEWRNNSKYSSSMLDAMVIQFFIVLLRNHEDDAILPKIKEKEKDENIIIILNYLQNNYQNVSLQKVAQLFNYSERQIIRLIKHSTGKTFSALIQEIRMKQAINMLENSNININEISNKLGYKTTSYFSKIFKETYSILPGEYRKKLNNI